MHRMPLARPLGGNHFHTAILLALSGEPGPVKVLHADQVIGFDATTLVRVLFVNTHLMYGGYELFFQFEGEEGGAWLKRFFRNSMRDGHVFFERSC